MNDTSLDLAITIVAVAGTVALVVATALLYLLMRAQAHYRQSRHEARSMADELRQALIENQEQRRPDADSERKPG